MNQSFIKSFLILFVLSWLLSFVMLGYQFVTYSNAAESQSAINPCEIHFWKGGHEKYVSQQICVGYNYSYYPALPVAIVLILALEVKFIYGVDLFKEIKKSLLKK